MAALKTVILSNIQSHEFTTFEFPERGIVRIYGNNSNGKSVLVKALTDVITYKISKPSIRRSIIRRGHTFGELSLTRYDGTQLYVHIDLDAASTYAELTQAGGSPVRRYLADKSIPLLVKEFGFHFDEKSGLSLNIHADTDQFLFVDTKRSTNFDMLNGVRSDVFAESALASISNLLRASKKQRDDILHVYDVACATRDALDIWDIEEEDKVRTRCSYWADVLTNLTLTPPPAVSFPEDVICLKTITFPPKIRFPKLYSFFTEPMPEIAAYLDEMQSLDANLCPYCGRPFVQEGDHQHEMVP